MKTKYFCLLILWAVSATSLPAHAILPLSAAPLLKTFMRDAWDLRPGREIPQPSVQIVQTETREIHTVSFQDPKLGAFRMVIEGPPGFRYTERLRPILFMTAGFFSGTKPLSLMRNAGDVVAIAFEYSPSPETALLAPEQLAHTLLQIPGRLYVSLRWIEQQSWFVASQFHVMGVSLGSLYLPSALALLQEDGFSARSIILAFGGADTQEPLRRILGMNFSERDVNEAMKLLGPLSSPMDPRLYLPTLRGRKLVIHGSRDAVFAGPTQRKLDESLPSPKMTCVIEGGHIDLDKPEEIALTLGILQAWIQSSDWPEIRQETTSCRLQLH